MKLSACLIVRDEERCLARCLSSLETIADELVVLDTGSVDQTPAIARAHGARVFHETWQDDFSKARNRALDHATGDWVVYIDADEQWRGSIDTLSCLDDPDVVAATVGFTAASRLTPYREYRLFRRRPDIRFRSPIHETIVPDLKRLQKTGEGRIVHTDAAIDHDGYDGPMQHKHQRNHPMLQHALALDPERIYLWHAMGECELGLDRPDAAEGAWRRGLERVRTETSHSSHALIYSDLLSLHFMPGGRALQDVDELLAEALEHHADDPFILFWRARRLLQKHAWQEARKLLQRLIELGHRGFTDSSLAYDKRLFNSFSYALLAACDSAEERHTDALEWMERACRAEPDSQEYAVKAQWLRSRLKD